MLKKRRKHKHLPQIIGLTGSIAMGKSTAASMFARFGVPVCDSDKIVHKLLGSRGAAVETVAALFPHTRGEYGIDRKVLGREVFANPASLEALEAILHPLVRKGQEQFIRHMHRMGRKAVLLDIPLLFETSAEARCDRVVVVSAPRFIQRQRALARPGMTEEKFRRILARQMPDNDKRKRADLTIDTGLGKALSFRQIKQFLMSRA